MSMLTAKGFVALKSSRARSQPWTLHNHARWLQVRIEHLVVLCNLADVKWLHSVVTLTLLALWAPVTSLCLVERAGWLADDDCCPSSAPRDQSTPRGDSPCCALASATYKLSDERTVVVIPVVPLVAPLAVTLDEPLVLPPSHARFRSVAPPHLPATWQFLLRTALPPRAPSLAS